MHLQIDVVAIGSSLGLALANTFCWLPWIQPFQTTFQPEMYHGMTLFQYSATKISAIIFHTSASTRFTLLFALLLKKNLTWSLILFWTCWSKKHFSSSLPPSTGNSHSPVNIYPGIPQVHRNAKLTYSWPECTELLPFVSWKIVIETKQNLVHFKD